MLNGNDGNVTQQNDTARKPVSVPSLTTVIFADSYSNGPESVKMEGKIDAFMNRDSFLWRFTYRLFWNSKYL